MDASSRVNRKKNYSYAMPRHSIQAVVFLCIISTAGMGFPLLLDWVEPYGIFARGVRVIFRPLYAGFIALWNLSAKALGLYGPAPVVLEHDLPVVIVSAVLFTAIAVTAFFKGRLYCRSLCPAGTLLELVASRPVFGIRIDQACTKCRACEKACPASCIDAGKAAIDSGRCILCLSCTGVCPAASIGYGRPTPQRQSSGMPLDRRNFLAIAGFAALGALVPAAIKKIVSLQNNAGRVTLSGISRTLALAPGAVSLERYARFCTACGLCVSRCPTGVLRHLNPGIGKLPGSFGGGQPFLDYSRAYCTYDCVACSRVCPTGSLLRLTPEAKRTTALGESRFERSRCIVITNGTSCGACAEHCPTGAVTMRMLEQGKPTEPFLENDLCVGCGACEKVCPSLPLKAIWVAGLPRHRAARLPSGGTTDAASGGFGF